MTMVVWNDGDEGSESDSGDDEGGGTDQLISTFRLEVESDIEKRTTLMMIHYILHDKDAFFYTQINQIACRDVNEGPFYL